MGQGLVMSNQEDHKECFQTWCEDVKIDEMANVVSIKSYGLVWNLGHNGDKKFFIAELPEGFLKVEFCNGVWLEKSSAKYRGHDGKHGRWFYNFSSAITVISHQYEHAAE